MICTKEFNVAEVAISSRFGTLDASSGIMLGAYASAFATVPSVAITASSSSHYSLMTAVEVPSTLATAPRIALIRPNDTTVTNIIISIIAVGRWEAWLI